MLLSWRKARLSAVRLHEDVNALANSGKQSSDAVLTKRWPWLWRGRGVWLGMMAIAVSLTGTELLALISWRVSAVVSLRGAGILAVLAWNNSQLSSALPGDRNHQELPP